LVLVNTDIYTYVQTVCTRPLLGGEGPGDEAKCDQAPFLIFGCAESAYYVKMSRFCYGATTGESCEARAVALQA